MHWPMEYWIPSGFNCICSKNKHKEMWKRLGFTKHDPWTFDMKARYKCSKSVRLWFSISQVFVNCILYILTCSVYSCDVFPVFLCFASWHCQTFLQIYSVIVAALHCVLTLPCSIKTDKLTQAIVRIEQRVEERCKVIHQAIEEIGKFLAVLKK